MPLFRSVLSAMLLAAGVMAPTIVQAQGAVRLERVVMLMRHGVRAPLSGEVPDGTRAASAWPAWSVPAGQLTSHGAAAVALVARHDRRWLAPLAPARCPRPGSIVIRSNSEQRTIATGEAYARGFAPGCDLAVEHLAPGTTDPMFVPLGAGATAFDPAAAIASIQAYTGGMTRLVERHRPALAMLDRVLACTPAPCSPEEAPTLTPSADGRGVDLGGPIRRTSGIAQVLLLEQAEGMPAAAVGWGRASPATIERLGALHAALFDVFTRSPYMAAHQAAVFGRRMIATLTAPQAPQLEVLVGHDTNVTALAAVLHVDLTAPGFARNDATPGGALVVERLRDTRSGVRYVRLFYRTQSLAAIRTLSPAVAVIPIAIPDCAAPCRLDRFAALLASRIAPLKEPVTPR